MTTDRPCFGSDNITTSCNLFHIRMAGKKAPATKFIEQQQRHVFPCYPNGLNVLWQRFIWIPLPQKREGITNIALLYRHRTFCFLNSLISDRMPTPNNNCRFFPPMRTVKLHANPIKLLTLFAVCAMVGRFEGSVCRCQLRLLSLLYRSLLII